MSDDWQIGDKAVCVNDTPHPLLGGGVNVGRTYTVAAVIPPSEWYMDREAINVGLEFTDAPHSGTIRGWACERFRKIRPDKHESCEPEFVTLLKRAKRKVSA